jgi:tetratricopeptide (TPR) repeat protein
LWVTGREAVAIVGARAVALAVTVATIRREAAVGWCAVWFWIAILPAGALGFVSRLVLYQDHRVYLAGVGLAWMGGHLAAGVLRWAAARSAMRAAAAVAVIVVIAAAVKADTARTGVWASRGSLWDDVLAKYPASLMAHNGKGMEAFDAGRYEEARDWFERAVHITPGYAEGHNNLGTTLARLEDWDGAIAALMSALAIHPGYTEARVTLGKVYERINRPDLALEAYDRVLRDDPGYVVLLAHTAWLLGQMGRPTEAVERYQRAVATGRADLDTAMDFGVLLLRLERWSEAEQVFATVATRDPNLYQARFNLGTALEGRGDWDRAVDEYRRAAELSARDPDPIFRIGVLFSKQERWEEAAAAYDEALTRDSRHAPTHMNLGILAERLGDVPGAIGHYEAVLRAPASRPGDAVLQARARDVLAALRGVPKADGGRAESTALRGHRPPSSPGSAGQDH